MKKKLKYPNEEQEKEICNIILNGGKIQENVRKYLMKNNLSTGTRDKSYSVKTLIHNLINKYELNKNQHIDSYPCLYDLTQEEFDVIVGGLLGDTWIGYLGQAKNPCGSFTHKIEHSPYVEYKYNLIKRRCSEITIHNKLDKRTNRKYQQCFCKIAASPVLIPIREAFYKDNIKIVPEELINKLSPLGIAIWFMDDGASTDGSYKFSVDCFTKEDIEKLSKMLKDKFGIDTTIQINQNKVLRVCSKSAKTFKKLVEPYMCDCMKYKLQIYKYINGVFQRVDLN